MTSFQIPNINYNSNKNNQEETTAKELKRSQDYNSEEFQEIEIPIDDYDHFTSHIEKIEGVTTPNDKSTKKSNNINNNNINNNNEYSIDIDSSYSDDESDVVDYKTIQPGVIKAHNKVVLVIVNNKDGTLTLNAKYPRELSHCFSSSDFLQIKSEINSLKSHTDSLFNRLIVAFSVGGAICVLVSLLLWYINSNFITIGSIVCLSVGVLLWIVFGIFIELKHYYRIKNRKDYFKDLNRRFDHTGLRFRAKYDKSRHQNPIGLILEFPKSQQ
ncbi:hypothetical protein DICPUDRAFT_148062 [Dictyostelium purpureum]|uniref:Uncharacterized protein n=1 Tax=Dictyostelium purpureum TaxID=5786 RepID=F0ZA51_DICPU|nr:uncharacterized protein DICPUDRAFT_148062 [Dictyostelium purpureum]EGC39174.1 hypothetical protein DICPUDRAFT_148062 [Dictyostelium purpureum]|eukprot:XP_003284320.1 hypothetical protein DICPUDRAFT_148062 [Dictyostelium purpureum]